MIRRILKSLGLIGRLKSNSHPSLNDADYLRIGKLLIPSSEGPNHFGFIGTTGSGKTTLMRTLAQSALKLLGIADCRAFFNDPKQDAYPILSGIVGEDKVISLNPFDKRGRYWDLSVDLDEPRVLEEFSYNLILEKNESQPFFTEAARELLNGLMLSYFLSGFKYTLADVLRPLRDRKILKQILTRHAATRHIAENYLTNKRLASNLMPSIGTKIKPFESIAACWSKADKGVSIREWANGNHVLLLGNSEVSRHAIDSVNRTIFKRVSDVILDKPESHKSRTWVFLDELADAGKLPGLVSLAKKGRSKGACIAIAYQSISGLKDESHYGQFQCDELLGQIGTRFIGRLECVPTAEYASNLVGEQKFIEKSWSYTSARESSSTTTYSTQVRKAILPSTFLSIKPCSRTNGLTGYYVTRSVGTFKTTIPGSWLFDELLTPPDPNVAAFEPRDSRHQILEPWTEDEARKFGVDISVKDTGTPTPSTVSVRTKKRIGRESKSRAVRLGVRMEPQKFELPAHSHVAIQSDDPLEGLL